MDRLSELVKEENEYLEKVVETKYEEYVQQEDEPLESDLYESKNIRFW